MNELNFLFLEEFKNLEKICGEIYEVSTGGVTEYINDMKNVSIREYKDIPNWKEDLNDLKRVRHIRNRLAHEQGAFDEITCKQDDIDWIKMFHDRLSRQSDPMAMLNKKKSSEERVDFSWKKVVLAVVLFAVLTVIGNMIIAYSLS